MTSASLSPFVYPPKYGGFVREMISHHTLCVVRGRGTACGCEPIRTTDFITPRSAAK